MQVRQADDPAGIHFRVHYSNIRRLRYGPSTMSGQDVLGEDEMDALMNGVGRGDILTTDFAGQLTVFAEDVPIFRGTFGLSRGQQAIKLNSVIQRPRTAQPPSRAIHE